LGLEPRRKSRKGDVVSVRFTVVPRVARVSSGLDEGCGGFAAKFGWLSRVGWRRVRGREESDVFGSFRQTRWENKWTIAPEGERKQFEMNLRAKRGASSSGTTKRGLLASSELQCACRVAPLDGESWC